MTVHYSTDIKSGRMNLVIAGIDGGADHGTLEICTNAYGSVLCIMDLNKPSFTENNGVITLAGVPKLGLAIASGEAAVARCKDSDDNIKMLDLTVGVGAGDIQLNDVDLIMGQTVTITSGTIAHS